MQLLCIEISNSEFIIMHDPHESLMQYMNGYELNQEWKPIDVRDIALVKWKSGEIEYWRLNGMNNIINNGVKLNDLLDV